MNRIGAVLLLVTAIALSLWDRSSAGQAWPRNGESSVSPWVRVSPSQWIDAATLSVAIFGSPPTLTDGLGQPVAIQGIADPSALKQKILSERDHWINARTDATSDMTSGASGDDPTCWVNLAFVTGVNAEQVKDGLQYRLRLPGGVTTFTAHRRDSIAAIDSMIRNGLPKGETIAIIRSNRPATTIPTYPPTTNRF